MMIYLIRITTDFSHDHMRCIELLRALTSAPESPPQKPVDHVQNRMNSNETESTSGRTQNHSLSFVREISLNSPTIEQLTVVTNALPFVNGPRVIDISIYRESYDVQLIETLVSCIPFTSNLYKLLLISINLTAKSATDIFKQLHQAHNLHKLALSDNNLYATVSDLAKNLHHLPQLTKLNLSSVDMGDKECRLLAESLKFVRKLQVLNLSFNPLSQGICELAKHLFNVPHLTELELRDTQMGEKEVTAVARSLQSISKLKNLYLSSNPLGQGIIELSKHLPSVPYLTELNLERTQMGEKEVTAVARSLQSISKLEDLTLASNPLGQGIIELSKHLPSVPHLTELNLRDTQMGEKEVTAVACALKDLPELEWLDLSLNPLGRGVSELTQHLNSIPQLRRLGLWGVKMTKKEASELCAAVQGKGISLYTDYHVSFFTFIVFCIYSLYILPFNT